MERPFLRDVVFYIVAAFWAFYIFYRYNITVVRLSKEFLQKIQSLQKSRIAKF
jgi:hypothetical protein